MFTPQPKQIKKTSSENPSLDKFKSENERLKEENEKLKITIAKNESNIMAFKQAVMGWQKKYNDLGSVLAQLKKDFSEEDVLFSDTASIASGKSVALHQSLEPLMSIFGDEEAQNLLIQSNIIGSGTSLIETWEKVEEANKAVKTAKTRAEKLSLRQGRSSVIKDAKKEIVKVFPIIFEELKKLNELRNLKEAPDNLLDQLNAIDKFLETKKESEGVSEALSLSSILRKQFEKKLELEKELSRISIEEDESPEINLELKKIIKKINLEYQSFYCLTSSLDDDIQEGLSMLEIENAMDDISYLDIDVSFEAPAPDSTYWYRDLDIYYLLRLYNNDDEGKKLYHIAPPLSSDELHLTQSIRAALEDIKSNNLPVLLPINLGFSKGGVYKGLHWVSLVIKNTEEGLVALYSDSLGCDMDESIPYLREFLKSIHIDNIEDLSSEQQDNGYDCGPITVFNLFYLATKGKLPDEITEEHIIDQRKFLGDALARIHEVDHINKDALEKFKEMLSLAINDLKYPDEDGIFQKTFDIIEILDGDLSAKVDQDSIQDKIAQLEENWSIITRLIESRHTGSADPISEEEENPVLDEAHAAITHLEPSGLTLSTLESTLDQDHKAEVNIVGAGAEHNVDGSP